MERQGKFAVNEEIVYTTQRLVVCRLNFSDRPGVSGAMDGQDKTG